jgi:hypothetical protein
MEKTRDTKTSALYVWSTIAKDSLLKDKLFLAGFRRQKHNVKLNSAWRMFYVKRSL